MSNTPHTLGEEFPGQLDALHTLKTSDPDFAQVLARYDEVNDRIHRAETRIEPVSEDVEHGLRKQRLALKDEIAAALARS